MEIRYSWNPQDVKHYTTEQLRKEFLIKGIFNPGEIKMVYSHVDRIIVGGACPVGDSIELVGGKELGSSYFLERRELGIINIGGAGIVVADGVEYNVGAREGLYIGMGTKQVIFKGIDKADFPKFYFNSTPAHRTCPTKLVRQCDANPNPLGTHEECNKRTIYQYVHPAVLESCQLVMGMTILEPGSIWNTMPCHTHDRRMEVYLYFDLPENAAAFHFMGEPSETRHIIMRNEEAVISPSWSIHTAAATRNYTFIWGMAGENQEFTDMDFVDIKDLK